MVGQRPLERGPLSVCPYGAASSPKGRAKVASLRRNDTAKLQFGEMLLQTDVHNSFLHQHMGNEKLRILSPVMKMNSEKEVLTSVLKTTQMGQIGIRSALDMDIQPELRSAMESQLREYDAIESEAQRIAGMRNWKLKEVNPSVRAMANRMTRTRLSFGDRDSKLAAMMIHGNTRGIIKGTRMMNHADVQDGEVLALGRKLLKTEDNNVMEMKPFL